MMNYVCEKNCAGRSPTCHCTCEKYLKARERHNAELKKINAEKSVAAGITESQKKLYHKYERRKNK